MENITPEHLEQIALHDEIVTPDHAARIETPEFIKSKERLKEDAHNKCWICGSTDNIQIHHYGCEYSLQNICDFVKLKTFLLEWDVYGYSKTLVNIPLTSVDDIRNMMALCQSCHTGVDHVNNNATGIHYLVFPMWIARKLCKVDPVPSGTETNQQVEDEVKKIETV